MKRWILKLGIFILLIWAIKVFAQEIPLPPPEKFHINLPFALGFAIGIFYKAFVGALKNLYGKEKQFSWIKLSGPVIVTVITTIPMVIFVLPYVAHPSGKFLPDFLYAFSVAYIVCDFSADSTKLAEFLKENIEKKKKKRKK